MLMTQHVAKPPVIGVNYFCRRVASGKTLPKSSYYLTIDVTSLPQHSTNPSVLIPQVWLPPALTEANEPSGGRAWPCTTLILLGVAISLGGKVFPHTASPILYVTLIPQHSTEPPVRTPQVWSPPALTEANSPDGGEAFLYQLDPQHSTEPSILTPHVCEDPALTEANSPDGGVAWPSSSSPQHSTEPSVLTPQVCQDPALTEANSSDDGVAWP